MNKSIIVALLILFAIPAWSAPDATATGETALLSDGPGGVPEYTPGQPRLKPDADWVIRTGYKKGIVDHQLPDELWAGPDIAVLKAGFFPNWPPLLTEFKEPSVFVQPERVAGLGKSKPILIIPSGALAGLSGSEFIKAGLTQYVRTGGIVICFTQKNGEDFSVLPVPAGSSISAIGWSQDSGPLFRAVAVQTRHPILSSLTRPDPAVQTDGYISSYPITSLILLSRTDGFPVFIVYPFGNGFVAISTLYSDVSHSEGTLETEEKALVSQMIAWAKNPAHMKQVAPGGQLSIELLPRDQSTRDAATANVTVFGPDRNALRSETLKLSETENRPASFTYTIPSDAKPGIYQVEYLLFNSAGKRLTPWIENSSASFSIGPTGGVAPPRRVQHPAMLMGKMRISSSVGTSGTTMKGGFTIAAQPASSPEDYIARVAEQEKSFKSVQGTVNLAFDIPKGSGVDRIPYIIYHATGRIAARGSIPVSPDPGNITFDRSAYAAGDKSRIKISGLGNGEIRLAGFGQKVNQVITGSAVSEMPIPADILPGRYNVNWEFRSSEGQTAQGNLPVLITGNGLVVRTITLEKHTDKKSYAVKANFNIQSHRKMSSLIKLYVYGPDGKLLTEKEEKVDVSEGHQSVPLTLLVKPAMSGIHELRYEISGSISRDASPINEPALMATGRKLFDIGDVAVLGVMTDKPVYYEAHGPVELSIFGYCSEHSKIQVELDGKKVKREKLNMVGPCELKTDIPSLKQGNHIVRAVITGERLENSREYNFFYGAMIPDLVVNLKPVNLAGMITPIPVLVSNQGKQASGPTRVALYDGDPAERGSLIGKADIPPLTPGTQHIASINYSLAGKAGVHVLYAAVDPDAAMIESERGNNTASLTLKIPEILLRILPTKSQFSSDEKIEVSVIAANVASTKYKPSELILKLMGAAGAPLAAEPISLPALAPGNEYKFDREITLASPPLSGAYQVSADIAGSKPISTAATISVLPTLSLAGSFADTPATAFACKPFTIRFSAKTTGNVEATSGAVIVNVVTEKTHEAVYTKQFDLKEVMNPITFEHLDFAPGSYSMVLRGKVSNAQHRINREFTITEQPLVVKPPIEVRKNDVVLPRVLILTGQGETTVQNAMIEKILNETFDQEPIFHKICNHAEDFMNQATSGIFNVYLLLEQTEMIPGIEWLQDDIKRGSGLIIVGDGERPRATAESFGFRFNKPLPEEVRTLSLSGESGLSISGTLPVYGKILPPEKKGAQPIAVVSGSEEPAMVTDKFGNGKVFVMPFSVIRSSIDTGASPLYSALLSSIIPSVMPLKNDADKTTSAELSISSPAGPTRTKLIETLPAGANVLWTTPETKSKGTTLTFEMNVDNAGGKAIFLFQPQTPGDNKTSTEVFYECKGNYVSQGKIE